MLCCVFVVCVLLCVVLCVVCVCVTWETFIFFRDGCHIYRVRSVSSTIFIGSISYLHILSSNLRRCVACKVCCKIQQFVILANSLNL